MMNRKEINEEMIAQVNGGKSTSYMGNPYSTNAPWSSMNEKKGTNDAK